MPYEAQLSYQVCPIILTGGIAGQIPGGMLPMLSLFQTGFTNSLGLPFDIGDLDNAFAAFNVLPGGTLVSQTIGKYPFANQSVAANAVIREPLTVSVIMDTPMRGPFAWQVKQAIMTSLKGTLERHNDNGGTFTVATPAYMYDNLILTSLTDNSRGNNSIPQNAWRFDFERPLVALAELQGAQNQLMQKITNGLPTDGSMTGIMPGLQSGQATQAQTIKAVGGLTAGTPAFLGSPPTGTVQNFPAVPPAVSFPYKGVS
jgi:hypothetical protein